MLDHHEPICRNIQQGKCYSSRHEDFKKGGNARRNLINKSYQASAIFGTEIDQQVMDWLHDRGHGASEYNNTDYCLKVLKMELLIRLFMDITYCKFDEAEPKIFYHFAKRKKDKPSAAP